MNTYTRILSQVNYTAFLALLVSLPFPIPFIRICWLVWAFTWLLEFRYLHRANIRKNKSILYLSLGVAVWLVWNLVSVFWAQNSAAVWASMERYTSLLAIPLIGIWGVNERYDWKQCAKVLLASSLISVGVYMFTHFWVINNLQALDKNRTDLIPIDWLHMEDLLMNIKHRMHYTNLLCLLVPCLVLLRKELRLWHLIPAGIVLLAAIRMSGSRIALVNLLIVLAITLCYLIIRSRRKWMKPIGITLTVIAILGIGFVGLYFHPRNAGLSLSEMMQVNESSDLPAFEPRFAIWQTALEQPSDYMAYGLGAGNASDYLQAHYISHGWDHYAMRHFSPHNQYLAVCMELGLAAAILFVLFWLGIAFFVHGRQRYWALCTIGICMCSMMIDLLLGGLEGIVFINIAFILGLLLPQSETTGLQSDAKGE